jgi:hypothetical protein
MYVCLEGEMISVKLALFGLVVENSMKISDISENMRRVLIFTIMS